MSTILTPEEEEIALRHLALVRERLRQRADEYYQPDSHLSRREQYKRVEKYHLDCRRIIEKASSDGWAEIAKLREKAKKQRTPPILTESRLTCDLH